MTVPEAARIVGISRSAGYRAAHKGEIPTIRIGGRHVAADTPADRAPDQQHTLQMLDDTYERFDPAVNWAGFVLELWARRRRFRLALERGR